jgi:hypothetical protein
MNGHAATNAGNIKRLFVIGAKAHDNVEGFIAGLWVPACAGTTMG